MPVRVRERIRIFQDEGSIGGRPCELRTRGWARDCQSRQRLVRIRDRIAVSIHAEPMSAVAGCGTRHADDRRGRAIGGDECFQFGPRERTKTGLVAEIVVPLYLLIVRFERP